MIDNREDRGVWVVFNKSGSSVTKIQHGMIPRQGSSLKLFITFEDENMLSLDKGAAIAFKIPGQESFGPAIGLDRKKVTFYKEKNEMTYNLVDGKEYNVYSYEEPVDKYEGNYVTAKYGNLGVLVAILDKSNANVGQESEIDNNIVYVNGVFQLYVEPTYGKTTSSVSQDFYETLKYAFDVSNKLDRDGDTVNNLTITGETKIEGIVLANEGSSLDFASANEVKVPDIMSDDSSPQSAVNKKYLKENTDKIITKMDDLEVVVSQNTDEINSINKNLADNYVNNDQLDLELSKYVYISNDQETGEPMTIVYSAEKGVKVLDGIITDEIDLYDEITALKNKEYGVGRNYKNYKNNEGFIGETFNDYNNNKASNFAHAEGYYTEAGGIYSHTEGYHTLASDEESHAEGYYTRATGKNSHSEGNQSEASGESAHAEGGNTLASAKYSHSEGENTTASGKGSHSEGYYCESTGNYSHSEGMQNKVYGMCAHIEGIGNTIEEDGHSSHAEGSYNVAQGESSHVEGTYNKAIGMYSHVGGFSNVSNYDYQTIIGCVNDNKEGTLLEVGNGADAEHPSNALEVYGNGDLKIYGNAYKVVNGQESLIVSQIELNEAEQNIGLSIENLEERLNNVSYVSYDVLYSNSDYDLTTTINTTFKSGDLVEVEYRIMGANETVIFVVAEGISQTIGKTFNRFYGGQSVYGGVVNIELQRQVDSVSFTISRGLAYGIKVNDNNQLFIEPWESNTLGGEQQIALRKISILRTKATGVENNG